MGADDIGIRKDCLQNVSSLHNTLTGSFGDTLGFGDALGFSEAPGNVFRQLVSV
jgi:hypothetical protein